jgi:hypothetical protein
MTKRKGIEQMTGVDERILEESMAAQLLTVARAYPVEVTPMDRFNRPARQYTPDRLAQPQSSRALQPDRHRQRHGRAGSTIGGGLGAKVALIENLMGGDCLNAGCVPSKSIIRSAKAIGEIRRAQHFGIDVAGDVTADFGAVMARMRELRAAISHDDSVQRVTGAGVDLYFGAARFTGPDAIEVDHDGERVTLHFAKAVITTGSKRGVSRARR